MVSVALKGSNEPGVLILAGHLVMGTALAGIVGRGYQESVGFFAERINERVSEQRGVQPAGLCAIKTPGSEPLNQGIYGIPDRQARAHWKALRFQLPPLAHIVHVASGHSQVASASRACDPKHRFGSSGIFLFSLLATR